MRGKSLRFILFLMVAVTLSALVYGYAFSDNNSFVGSSIDEQFPVPAEARKSDVPFSKPGVVYVRYNMKGIEEKESIPDFYANEIRKWGWKEDKEEQVGALRVFVKDGKTMNITTHTGYFTLFTKKSSAGPHTAVTGSPRAAVSKPQSAPER
ncbi:hypothetical protein SAMN04487970_102135 [Paenibacillus tianmuensis]|uniref:Uncharacterized protein n=1 Tax=Paenibacillus tianmuensis TaxID=624147 RepID=A0A1G4RZ35_9BACL|nr:hypothetical protein [Paenibacillus tianmuensis]SCW62154.1 hypothetical protein SAMN04487970_102135 [Paenibacillus tianmuensis]